MPRPPRSRTIRLALLIDADNASGRVIEPLLNEVAKYGEANVKRIYGDWTTPNLRAWKASLNRFAIRPVQQFRYAAGKNATDSALIIDAMDLLHAGHVDGFCLVSSDSDFTRLACRMRESGFAVYGFGEKKTPEPFVRACDRFLYFENFADAAPLLESAPPSSDDSPPVDAKPLIGPEQSRLLHAALDALAPEGGWVTLASLGNQILKLSPSFDPRTYGYRKLSELIAATVGFRLDPRPADGRAGPKQLYVAASSRSCDGDVRPSP